ncbi:MAG: hypothetical protein PHU46_05820 [Rhodocyclaceae bacterium]|nr:hypothetical protein [Rhodocyclaceae bacterium]
MAFEYVHEVLEDQHIERPERSVLVWFHHKPYRPAGFDSEFPGRNILVEVRCETEDGAIAIAARQHRLYGEQFEVERRPWQRRMHREVVIEERATPR